MQNVGLCYWIEGKDGYLVEVWGLGKSILADNGYIVSKSNLMNSGHKLKEFKVDASVYQKLMKINGVAVSELLLPGDELMIFQKDYKSVVLTMITEKDCESNIYMTESGLMVPFGSAMGIYTKFKYPKLVR